MSVVEFDKKANSSIIDILADIEKVKADLCVVMSGYSEEDDAYENIENALEALDDAIDEIHEVID